MAKAKWEEVEALAAPFFDAGEMPERGDLIERAYQVDASDDVIDALDTLRGHPIASLEQLKELLTANAALE
ncbi:MAG TPA: hypothetical protein PKA49_07340 [Tepidiformaceae bacterium]|jgi:hypothetical protein|nr:hypothetical protein [Thermoflexaceae bacterium]HMS58655.1 hypothetical protein [Tepidiformaceae bacterium]